MAIKTEIIKAYRLIYSSLKMLSFYKQPKNSQHKKVVILTRNATHGGVETIIKYEAIGLNADVIVCGGMDCKKMCPFPYTRADRYTHLLKKLRHYQTIIYHWVPDYALKAVKDSKKPAIEFVHMTATNDADKSMAKLCVTHSSFLAKHVEKENKIRCEVVPHPVDTDLFVPSSKPGYYIGGVTSYVKTKGVDLFIRAWAQIKAEFPHVQARFYGTGELLPALQELSDDLHADVEFLPATTESNVALRDFCCIVSSSRMEGMPVVILEALAMNIPVISSDLDGMSEFQKKASENGFPDILYMHSRENVPELARVIKEVLTTLPKQCTRNYIVKNYYPQKHIDKLGKIIAEITV